MGSLRCDQMIGPWRDVHSVIGAEQLEQIGMAIVESGCDCGVGESCQAAR